MSKLHTDKETQAIVQRIREALSGADDAIPRVWRHNWVEAVIKLSLAKGALALAIEDINEIRDREHFERLEKEVKK